MLRIALFGKRNPATMLKYTGYIFQFGNIIINSNTGFPLPTEIYLWIPLLIVNGVDDILVIFD
jgi:hypothetical protein